MSNFKTTKEMARLILLQRIQLPGPLQKKLENFLVDIYLLILLLNILSTQTI